MSMIERVARAAHDSILADPERSSWPDSDFSVSADIFRDAARAAIAAMRESTPDMWIAGGNARAASKHADSSFGLTAKEQWEAMIDAALKGNSMPSPGAKPQTQASCWAIFKNEREHNA